MAITAFKPRRQAQPKPVEAQHFLDFGPPIMNKVREAADSRKTDYAIMEELEWAARHGDITAQAALDTFAPAC